MAPQYFPQHQLYQYPPHFPFGFNPYQNFGPPPIPPTPQARIPNDFGDFISLCNAYIEKGIEIPAWLTNIGAFRFGGNSRNPSVHAPSEHGAMADDDADAEKGNGGKELERKGAQQVMPSGELHPDVHPEDPAPGEPRGRSLGTGANADAADSGWSTCRPQFDQRSSRSLPPVDRRTDHSPPREERCRSCTPPPLLRRKANNMP